ncbi:hypothetical protein FQR65_LT04961 [Abscondita terminalis]|nr:hypothetical protein FQR65_LT04961 [Abscondita terminalis]
MYVKDFYPLYTTPAYGLVRSRRFLQTQLTSEQPVQPVLENSECLQMRVGDRVQYRRLADAFFNLVWSQFRFSHFSAIVGYCCKPRIRCLSNITKQMYNFVIVLFFIVLTSAEICPSEKETEFRNVRNYERLPDSVIPLHYDITLEPDFEKKTFTGSVSILIKFVKATKTIVLHADELQNLNKGVTEILCAHVPTATVTDATINDKNSFLTVTLNEEITASEETCNLKFTGFQGTLSLTDKSGLYLAKYVEDGVEKVFATTQFESFGARRAFPCFDEPHLKSTFAVTLTRPKNFISISNEELVESKELGSDKVRDVYRITRLMSTYLLAFIVSEYASTRTYLGQRVFGAKSAINNSEADFALRMGVEVLAAFEQYTEYRYSLGKIDQVAIPDSYFILGAMENWGIVTYRTSLLIYPYEYQTTIGLQKTISTIVHEYSHQWFGNLVTCQWWNYLWLNEGFANYFGYFASAMVRWDRRDIFVLDSVHNALNQDSKRTIEPMNHENASTIIVYQKAGSVIRMMSHVVTEKIFQKSLILYLKNNEYKAVTPAQLYQAFQTTIETENKTSLLEEQKISDIMTLWDSQPGYPVIYVTKTNENISLQQERFFTDNSYDNTTTWIIPITYVREGYPEDDFTTTTAQAWMVNNTMEIPLTSNGWVLLNKQQMGYYRVMYDENNWNQLVNQLINKNHTAIHLLNRAQLIDDAFTFASVDIMNYTKVLDFSNYLIKETDYVPIGAFLKHISVINNKLSYESGRKGFKIFLEKIFTGSILNTITMQERANDTLENKYLRIELINWLCRLGNKQCTSYALDAFNKNSTISPDMQEPIYCGAMRTANPDIWISLYEKLEEETNDLIRSRIINGLGCSESIEILTNYTEIILDSKNNISALNGFYSILNAGDLGVKFIWNYTFYNFNTIKNLTFAKAIMSDICQKLNTEEHKKDLLELYLKHQDAASIFNESLKIIEDNINWNNKYKHLKIWFEPPPPPKTDSAISLEVNLKILSALALAVTLINYFKC